MFPATERRAFPCHRLLTSLGHHCGDVTRVDEENQALHQVLSHPQDPE
jgi:hypothetical protein